MTTIEAEPLLATMLPDTLAVSCVSLTNVVGNDTPFHSTAAWVAKFAPFTVRINGLLPASIDCGDSEYSAGAGL